MNGFGPADIEKSHIKGIFGCIFKQSLMKYGGNKSIKENILRPWVLIPEDNRHSTVTRKIPLFSDLLHALLSSLIFTCKNYLHWDIFSYFYFFAKYIALLSLIVNKNEVFILIWRIYHCHFVRFCMTFWIYIHVRKWNENWILSLCSYLIKKNARKIYIFIS